MSWPRRGSGPIVSHAEILQAPGLTSPGCWNIVLHGEISNLSLYPSTSHDNVMSRNISESDAEYMLLFRGTDWHKGLSSETVQTVMNQWYQWFERLAEQGRATSEHPLAYEGKIVSRKKGPTVVDGPFVESKEAIGGYFLLHVKNEEEAIEIAKHCPGLEHGVQVQVRQCRGILPSGEIVSQDVEQLKGRATPVQEI